MPAGQAFRLMHTEQLTAPGTGPSFLFIPDEIPYAEYHYMKKIVDHAHAIPGSIAPIQVIQPVAGERVAAETVLCLTLSSLLAGLDLAREAGLWFDAVVIPAAGAWVLFSDIRDAKTAVHSARSDQRCMDHICLCRSYGRHVRNQ